MIKTNCTGETMIFRKDYDGKAKYSCTLSKKGADGEYENAFINIQFKKGVELSNKQKITLTEAWLTFYMNKDGKPVFYIFCNAFESDVPQGFQFAQLDEDLADVPF